MNSLMARVANDRQKLKVDEEENNIMAHHHKIARYIGLLAIGK